MTPCAIGRFFSPKFTLSLRSHLCRISVQTPSFHAFIPTSSYIFWPSVTVGSVVKNLPASAGDADLIPGSGTSPGEGNGSPLQYSCLGNPKGREEPGRLQSMESQKSWTQLSNSAIAAKFSKQFSFPSSVVALGVFLFFLISLNTFGVIFFFFTQRRPEARRQGTWSYFLLVPYP